MNEFAFITGGFALYILYATVSISLFLLALLGTYTKFKWRGPLITIFFAIFLGVSYVSLGELLGRPKPVEILSWERPDVEKAKVVSMFFDKGKAIYLLLMYEKLTAPRYYQFPWNDEMAKDLKRGEAGTRMKQNQGIMLKFPFQPTYETRRFPEVYEIPWPAPPQKDEPQIDMIDLNSIDV